MERKIGLVTLLTNNIEPMKEFYSKILGFPILEDLGNYVEFHNPGVRFALCTRDTRIMKFYIVS
jgi:catechol 2,3-dioxygenase-like lactoylglutathione lyase family enzyme